MKKTVFDPLNIRTILKVGFEQINAVMVPGNFNCRPKVYKRGSFECDWSMDYCCWGFYGHF